ESHTGVIGMAQAIEKVKVYVYRNTVKNQNAHYLYPMTASMLWMVSFGEVEATLSYDDDQLEKDSDTAAATNILAELEQARENVKVYVYRNTDKNQNELSLYPMTATMFWMVPLGEVEPTLSYDDDQLEKDSNSAAAKNILAEL